MVLIPWETAHAATPVVTTPVKWHPGHYYTLLGHGKNSDWYLSQVYRELKATPALKGVQIRYDWAELETSPGNYNFYPIVKRLSELSAIGKRLVVVIQMKSFGDGEIVPDYLLTPILMEEAYLNIKVITQPRQEKTLSYGIQQSMNVWLR